MLKDEIEIAQRLVRTDAYQLSISELVNMYKSGELVINPDFQRLFRWEIGQKAKLIESILLGIPLPPIFVFERSDSTWELIDGLQRISTILEFMGLLIDPETGKRRPPTALVATKYLPSLDGAVWERSRNVDELTFDEQSPIESALQLAIRRSRLGVEILKRPSSNETKYDLFQRLNAGGTAANAQELRNCVIIMVSPSYFRFIKGLSEDESFLKVVSPTDDQKEKQRHVEYVSRFLVHRYVDYDGKLDVEDYIDAGIVQLAEAARTQRVGPAFGETFRILNEAYGDSALRRFVDGNPTGRVGLAAFEIVAVGVAKNLQNISAKSNPIRYVKRRIEQLWETDEVDQFFSSGLRGTIRIQRTVPFGAKWFST
jgi:hypothetical protein